MSSFAFPQMPSAAGPMTEAPKHTPGPWLIADEDKSFVYALGPQRGNSFWAHVQSAGLDRIDAKERWANARLIAAAPDMLEALKDCREALRLSLHAGELAVVDAAIAKASGGTE